MSDDKQPIKKEVEKAKRTAKKADPTPKKVSPKAAQPKEPVRETLTASPEREKERKRFRLPKGLLSTIAVGVVVLAVGAIGLGLLGGGGGDSITEDQEREFSASQTELLQDGGAESRTLPKDVAMQRVREGAFGAMDDAVMVALLNEIQNGTIEVRELTFYDNVDEDGDVVRAEANGVVHEVPIWHEPASVLFPYYPGQDNAVLLQAAKDGQGGVTLGVISAGETHDLRPIPEGTQFTLPLK